jgi:hypothetical protein
MCLKVYIFTHSTQRLGGGYCTGRLGWVGAPTTRENKKDKKYQLWLDNQLLLWYNEATINSGGQKNECNYSNKRNYEKSICGCEQIS